MIGRRAFRWALAGAAGGGLLAGHALDYLLLFPGDERAHVLAHTGHAYLSRAPLLLAVTFAAAVAGALLAGASGHGSDAEPRPRRRSALATLALIQTSAFVILEIVERALSGSGFGDVLRMLPMGVVTQVALAVVLAAVLRVLIRAGARLAAAIRRPRPRGETVLHTRAQPAPLRSNAWSKSRRVRAPPLSFSY